MYILLILTQTPVALGRLFPLNQMPRSRNSKRVKTSITFFCLSFVEGAEKKVKTSMTFFVCLGLKHAEESFGGHKHLY